MGSLCMPVNNVFTITAGILVRSLANFNYQNPDRLNSVGEASVFFC